MIVTGTVAELISELKFAGTPAAAQFFARTAGLGPALTLL